MKKTIPIILSIVALIGITVYVKIAEPTKASNNLHDYEYYYSDDNIKKDSSNMPVLSQNQKSDLISDTIDTTPDSITVLVNKEYSLPSDYIPEDLVVPDILFNINRYDEKKLLRQEAATAIETLFQDAEEKGLSLYGISGYRSYNRQEQIYNTNIRTKGEEYTNRYSAKPGHSEHQTGLVMDVSTSSIGNRLEPVFAGTPEGKWLAENAHLYGFTIRYPEGKESITGYSYEPWHIRYVGKELAQKLYDNGLTLEEYYNYTPSEQPEEIDINYDSVIDVDESEEKEEINPSTQFDNQQTEKEKPVENNNKPSTNDENTTNEEDKTNTENNDSDKKKEEDSTDNKENDKNTDSEKPNSNSDKPNNNSDKENNADKNNGKEDGNGSGEAAGSDKEKPETETPDKEKPPVTNPEDTNSNPEAPNETTPTPPESGEQPEIPEGGVEVPDEEQPADQTEPAENTDIINDGAVTE